jgi:polysaccharide export outer membrane protein
MNPDTDFQHRDFFLKLFSLSFKHFAVSLHSQLYYLYQIDMKKSIVYLSLLAFILLFDSCVSYKKLSYFQNIGGTDLTQVRHFYDARIMVKDLITVNVSTTDPEAGRPFNLQYTGGSYGGYGAGDMIRSYLVNNMGEINFPVLGKVKVAGLTIDECQDMIQNRIKAYMSPNERPIVTVRLSSFHVTVLGEVGRPGPINASKEKLSIVDAIALAGDMTIYGKRENVLLIRENDDGKKEWHRLNFCDANIMNSPFYYLQQNDIIYVEPTNARKAATSFSSTTSLWMSFATTLISTGALVYSIVK